MLSDLVFKHHFAAARLGLRPVRFRKAFPTDQVRHSVLEGYFPELGIWHDFSWHKCLTPPTYADEVRGFFRQRVQDSPEWERAIRVRCEKCGGSHRLQVDHLSPTFKQIFDEAYELFTPEEIEGWFNHDWIQNEYFLLPDAHVVTDVQEWAEVLS